MHPDKVRRAALARLTDLPNVGPATAADLRLLGYRAPHEMAGADPLHLYQRLCALTARRHDPCVLDVFLSVTHFLAGAPPQPWWRYSARRKAEYPGLSGTDAAPAPGGGATGLAGGPAQKAGKPRCA